MFFYLISFIFLIFFIDHFTLWNIYFCLTSVYSNIEIEILFSLSTLIMFSFAFGANSFTRYEFLKGFKIPYFIFVIIDLFFHTFPFLFFLYNIENEIQKQHILLCYAILIIYLVLAVGGIDITCKYHVQYQDVRGMIHLLSPIFVSYLLNNYGKLITIISVYTYIYHIKDFYNHTTKMKKVIF